MALDAAGNLYISDYYGATGDNEIRVVPCATAAPACIPPAAETAGDIYRRTSWTGNGFIFLSVDSAGNLFAAVQGNPQVFEAPVGSTSALQPFAGNGTAGFSGDGGPAVNAELNDASGIYAANGNVYIADNGNARVRAVSNTGVISTYAGDGSIGDWGDGGPATSAELADGYGVATDTAGDIFIADSSDNMVREVSAATGKISVLAGTGMPGYSGDGGPAAQAELNFPLSVGLDGKNGLLIADVGSRTVREVALDTGIISTVAGNGTAGYSGDGGLAISAALSQPQNAIADAAGDIFIADSGNNRVREVTAATGVISTIAGNGTAGETGDKGPAVLAELFGPRGLALDATGDLFVSDFRGNTIREVVCATAVPGCQPLAGETAGDIYTIAGNGTAGYLGDGGPATSAELNLPWGLQIDRQGNIFIADLGNDVIREISPTGTISTIAGIAGISGFSGDGGPAVKATLSVPTYLALDPNGSLLIADTESERVRAIAGVESASASLSPTSLTFASQAVGTTSSSQALTVTNTGGANLVISAIAASAGFGVGSAGTCSTSTPVPAGGSCTVDVTFTPTAGGSSTGSLSLTDNASGSPQAAALTGAGADFTMGAASGGSTSDTVAPGQPATYNLSLTPEGGFTGSVALSCSGAPSEAACTVNPPTAALSGTSPASATVTVTTTASSLLVPPPNSGSPSWPPADIILLALLAVGLFFTGAKLLALEAARTAAGTRRPWPARWAVLALGLTLCLAPGLGLLAGCGGGSAGGSGGNVNTNPGTPAGTYTLTVSATSVNAKHTEQLTLTVN